MAARRVTLRSSDRGASAQSTGAAYVAPRGLARGRGAGRGRGRGSRESDLYGDGSWQKSGWTRSEGSNWKERPDDSSSSWKDNSWKKKWDGSAAAQTQDWSRSNRGGATASNWKDESPGRAPKVILRPAAAASRPSGVGRTSIEASSSRLPEKDETSRSGGHGVILEENRNPTRSESNSTDKFVTKVGLQAFRAMRDAKRASLAGSAARKQAPLQVGSRQRLSARRNGLEDAAEDSATASKQLSNRTSQSPAIEEQQGERDAPAEQNESRTRQRAPAAAARRILGQRAVARTAPNVRRVGQRAAPVCEVDIDEEQQLDTEEVQRVESDKGKASSSRLPLRRPSEHFGEAESARKSRGEVANLQKKPTIRVKLRRPVIAKPVEDSEAGEKKVRKPVLKASKAASKASSESAGPRRILESALKPKRTLGIANILRTALNQTHVDTPQRRQRPVDAVMRSTGPRNALGKQVEAGASEPAIVEDVLEEHPAKSVDDDGSKEDTVRKRVDVVEDRERGVKKGVSESEREPQHRRKKSSHQAYLERGEAPRPRKATLKRRSPSAAEGRAKRRRTAPKEQLEERDIERRRTAPKEQPEDETHLVEDIAQSESRNTTDHHSRQMEVTVEEEELPPRTVHMEKADRDQGSRQQVPSPDQCKQDDMQSKSVEDVIKSDRAVANEGREEEAEAEAQQRSEVDEQDNGDRGVDDHYIEGDRVEFWSQTHKCYTRTRVLQVNEKGDVILSCKKKAWILRKDHDELIKPCNSSRERILDTAAPDTEVPEEQRRTEHSPDESPGRKSDANEQREPLPRLDSRRRDTSRNREASGKSVASRKSPCGSERRRSGSHSATRSRSAKRAETIKPSDLVVSGLSQTGESTHAAQSEAKDIRRGEKIVEEAPTPHPPLDEDSANEETVKERDDPDRVGAATLHLRSEDSSEKIFETKKRQDEVDDIGRKVDAPDVAKPASEPKDSAEAEPEADVDSGSQNLAVAPDEHIYEKGERVEFWSQTHKQWTRTTIKDIRPVGEVLLACKSAWISKAEQATKMRPLAIDPPLVAPKGARAKAAPAVSHAPNKDSSATGHAKAVAATSDAKVRQRSPSDDKVRQRSPSDDEAQKRVAEAAKAIFASSKAPAEQKRSSSSSSSSSTHSVANSANALGNSKGEMQDPKKEESNNAAETLKSKAKRRGQEARASESPPKRGLSLELDDGVFEGSEDKQKDRKRQEDGKKEDEFCEDDAKPKPKSAAHGKIHRRRRQESSEPRENSPKKEKVGADEDDAMPKPKSGAHRKSHRRRKEESSEPREDSPKHDKGKLDLDKRIASPERGAKRDSSDGRRRKDSPQLENAKRSKRDRSVKKDSPEPHDRKGSLEHSEKKRENSKRRSRPEHRGKKNSPDRARGGSPERGKRDDSQDRKRGSPEHSTKKGSPERGRKDERGENRDKADHRRGGGSPRKNSGSARNRDSDDRDRRDSGGHDRGRGQDNRGRGQRDDAKSSVRRDRSPHGRTGTRGGDPGSGRRGRSRDAKPADGKRNARSRSDRKAPRHRDRSRR